MATQEWHDPVRALDHYAQATRRRAGAVDASTALTLSIAATQQADTAAFATQFGERIDALESYLATKRTNLKRVLQQGDAGTDSLIGISAADEARLDEDADDIAAIRREFQQYAERQATLARRVLLPLATARAPIAEDTGAREGITNMVRRMSHRFEPSTRSTWAIRGAVAAALIATMAIAGWSRTADVTAAAASSDVRVTAGGNGPAAGVTAPNSTTPWSPPASALADRRMVALYGHPNQPTMGALGKYSADDAAAEVARLAKAAGQPGAPAPLGALELIVSVAQASPTSDGTYLERMSDRAIQEYVDVARARGLHLILDVQIGWGDPLAETKRYERFLVNPFVHLALDPEFSTKRAGLAPGAVIGTLDAPAVNAVEQYLGNLVRGHQLPKKLLVIHQFTPGMLANTDAYQDDAAIERVIDMDGFGSPDSKLDAYNQFALASYGRRPAIKLFYEWDTPMLSNDQLDALPRPPELVIYQ